MSILTAPLLLLPLLSISTASAQSVLVVDDDGGPGVDFGEVQQAVDAAAPGDVVLIRAGTYAMVTVNLPLSLVADEGATVDIERILVLEGVTGDLVLSGLTLTTPFLAGLELKDVTGAVWVQDCWLGGGLGQPAVGSGYGASVLDCASVTFERCQLHGGFLDASGTPAPGASFVNSNVRLFESVVRGRDGEEGRPLFQPPQAGADGVAVAGSQVFCQGSTLSGGDGGDSGPFCAGEDGGDGAVLVSSELQLLDCVVSGGAGGSSQAACPPGASGIPVDVGTGTLVQHSGLAAALSVAAVGREREPVTFSVEGQPGERVFLGFGLQQAAQLLPFAPTPALIPPPIPALVVFLGVVPPTGTLNFTVPVASLRPSLQALRLQAQVALRSAAGWRLSNGRSLTLLDASF